MTVRVLVADAHAHQCVGIRHVLDAELDITVVGQASDGLEAQRLCQELMPDVLLMALNLPGPLPTETVTWVRRHCPPT